MKIEARCEEHEVCKSPPEAATIWRYIDFTKLISLLETQRLFFARADTFDDPFEGSITRPNVAARTALYESVLQNNPSEHLHNALTNSARITSKFRGWAFISCWNMSERESAALWGLYVPPHGGVALRSTVERLRHCFGPTVDPRPAAPHLRRIYFSQVQYVDYETDRMPEGNMMSPLFHKRLSFEFESEVRALILEDPGTVSGPNGTDFAEPVALGLEAAVDLRRLIEAIHVAPTAPDWFAELVRTVVSRYQLDRPVVQSSLSGSPVY